MNNSFVYYFRLSLTGIGFLISAPVGSKTSDFRVDSESLEAIDISETLIVMLVLLSIEPNLGSIPVICLRLDSNLLFLDLFLMIKSRTPAIIEIMTITTNTIIRNTTKIFESESKNFF